MSPLQIKEAGGGGVCPLNAVCRVCNKLCCAPMGQVVFWRWGDAEDVLTKALYEDDIDQQTD